MHIHSVWFVFHLMQNKTEVNMLLFNVFSFHFHSLLSSVLLVENIIFLCPDVVEYNVQ